MDVYFASFDSNWKQNAEASINKRVCECCQTATAVSADGPVVAFRDRSDQEIRDIHITRVDGGKWTDAVPVHADKWQIDACPVNGPALSARGKTVAVAWFTAAGGTGHAYAAFSQDAGRTCGLWPLVGSGEWEVGSGLPELWVRTSRLSSRTSSSPGGRGRHRWGSRIWGSMWCRSWRRIRASRGH